MVKSDASRLRKGLPWLKHLQAALNNDDSSDSSSQPTEVTPKKVGKTLEKEEVRDARRRIKKKRLRRDEGDSNDDVPSRGGDGAKDKKHRPPKKIVKARHKHSTSVEEARKAKSPVESAKAKAAALRGQRKQKLHAMRVTSGEHDRMAAFKLKRQQSAEALRHKERIRLRAVRAARGGQTTSTGVEADVEDEGEPRRRPRVLPESGKDTAVKTVKHRAMGSKKSKTKQIDPATIAEKDPVKDDVDDKSEVKSRLIHKGVIGKDQPSDLGKQDDDKTGDLSSPKTIGGEDGDAYGVSRSATEPAKSEDNAGEASVALKEKSSDLETTEINVKVEFEASEGAKSEQLSQEKPRGTDADATRMAPSSLSMNGALAEPSRPESEDHVKAEPVVDAEGAAELVEGEKKLDEKKLILDEMPIPRKAPKQELSVPPRNTESFKIPKRAFAKTGIVGHKASVSVDSAGTTEATVSGAKRSLKTSTLPLVSPQSSPSLPKDEPVDAQRKRTKNPVPLKRLSFSTQDRALMRLSRKRNSIFMAATDLVAQVPDIKSSKTGSVTQMMGYEVYDVDGKTLPDLIARLSCATKREMASDRESYAASFFGVSRSSPKAKRGPSSVTDECGDTDLDTRKMNCYEELSFERPEDREFYQRKLYGTAFVPQNVRGWITLIVRNTRFERKSTGIRFNQDRDREAFAAALSQRYTFNKSVPRCDIPRENWQKLMRNEPGTVYLHYYNREDAERAAQVFRDDFGQPLQIRWELKAGARIRRCSSLAVRTRPQLSPRRSCSSERSTPEPSPLSSHNGSARNTPVWRRERDSTSNSDHRYSRYDRGSPSAQWSRGESQEGRYGPALSGNKRSRALLERRSRSRSRSKSFHGQHYESSGQVDRAGPRAIGTNNQYPPVTDTRARTDGGNESASSAVHSDVSPAGRKRARVLPRRSPPRDRDRNMREDTKRDGEEVKSNSELVLHYPVGSFDGDGTNIGVQRVRSPSRRWQNEPHNAEARERRNSFAADARDRSMGPPAGQHRFNQSQQQYRDPVQARSRSRSRPRTSLPARDGHGGNNGGRYNERRGSREFGRGGGFNSNARERRMHSDREQGGRHDGRSKGVN